MTREADIVNRAGKFYVSGQFKIGDAAELFTFASRLSELVERAGIKKRPMVAHTEKREEAKIEAETKIIEKKMVIKKKINSNSLSPRENQIKELFEKGYDNRSICKMMGISLGSVYSYKADIKRKLGGSL